jgi:hypothetical protein
MNPFIIFSYSYGRSIKIFCGFNLEEVDPINFVEIMLTKCSFYLNNCLILCLLQLIKCSIGVVKIVNKLLLYNFVLGHVSFVCFTI